MKTVVYLIFAVAACCVPCTSGINGVEILDDKYEMENAYEPCKKKYENDCIRQFLSYGGQCQPTYGPKDKIVNREYAVFHVPKVNFSLVIQDAPIEGLDDSFVEEFYIDKKTNNLVFAVNFKKISLRTKAAFYIFHQRGKQPINIKDELLIQYGNLIITAVVPISEYGPNWKEAMINTYMAELPYYEVGASITASKNKIVIETFAQVALNVETTTPEALLTEGPAFFMLYLQNFICNYGIY